MYDDRYDFMETRKELILGEKPPRLDAVVLKKAPDQHLEDEIGCFFLEHNIFELKGYGDGINFNDVFKLEGYALFYMTIDRKVNEIPLESVTLTVLQYRFAREVFKELEEKGCVIRKRSEGIYEVSGGPIIFPLQIVDAIILGEEWDILKVLVPGATEEQVMKVQLAYENADSVPLKQHLEDVLRTSIDSNPEIYDKIREECRMSEAFERVFKKEIDEYHEKKTEEVVSRMLRHNEPVDKIVMYFGWTPERVMKFAKQIGINTLTL